MTSDQRVDAAIDKIREAEALLKSTEYYNALCREGDEVGNAISVLNQLAKDLSALDTPPHECATGEYVLKAMIHVALWDDDANDASVVHVV